MSTPTQAPSTLCLGESLIDAVTSGGSVTEHVGGSPLNVAVGLARLGHPTEFASWWGPDARGRRIAAALTDAGVVSRPGSDGATFTTVAHATIDADGQASYHFDMESGVAPLADLGQADHLHSGSIGAALDPGGAAIADAIGRWRDQATVSFDPNARPTLMGHPDQTRPRVEHLVSLADVVKASDEDLAWLYPGESMAEVMRAWMSLGPSLVVVTTGADGAHALLDSTHIEHIAPRRVEVADTVGAGDSFMAGLIGGLLDAELLGGPAARTRLRADAWPAVAVALRHAVAASAITVSHHGAYAPTPPEVSAFATGNERPPTQ